MEDLERALYQRKSSLLDTIQEKTNAYIVSTGRNCIGVVERDDAGDACVTWDFRDDLDSFLKRLYYFMRKKRAPSGRMLDSALTDPIIQIVKTEYENFYQSESDAISKGLLTELAADDVKLRSFVDRISDIALKKVSKEAKGKVVDLITHQIKESINQGALHHVGQQIGHLATTTAGTQIATAVTHILIKLLIGNLGAIVAKVLASAALQHALMLIAKKIVVAAVAGAVLNFLAIHFGSALAGASVMWIVLPIMAGYVAYKMSTFPRDLGKAVSKSVRDDLEKGFEGMNKTILQKIFDAVFSGNEIVMAISKDEDFQNALRAMGQEVDSKLYRMKSGQGARVNVKEIRV